MAPREGFTVEQDLEQTPCAASSSPWRLSQRGLCCAGASGEGGSSPLVGLQQPEPMPECAEPGRGGELCPGVPEQELGKQSREGMGKGEAVKTSHPRARDGSRGSSRSLTTHCGET